MPLSRVANMRSVHTLASVHSHLWGTSLPCLAFGTPGSLICGCVSFTLPPSCPPWLHGHYPLHRYYGDSDSCPAPSSTRAGLLDYQPRTCGHSVSTTPCAPVSRRCFLFRAGLTPDSPFWAIGGSSDFVLCSQSRQSHQAVSSLYRGPIAPSVLRTILSFPVALHAVSPGRSYFQLVAGSTATEGLPPSYARSFSSARAPSCTRLFPKNPAKSRLQAGAPTLLNRRKQRKRRSHFSVLRSLRFLLFKIPSSWVETGQTHLNRCNPLKINTSVLFEQEEAEETEFFFLPFSVLSVLSCSNSLGGGSIRIPEFFAVVFGCVSHAYSLAPRPLVPLTSGEKNRKTGRGTMGRCSWLGRLKVSEFAPPATWASTFSSSYCVRLKVSEFAPPAIRLSNSREAGCRLKVSEFAPPATS